MNGKRKYTIDDGPDLVDEDVVLPSGRRLTEEVRGELLEAARAEAARVGRPSLGKAGTRSPQVAFRLPVELLEQAERVASAEGATVSEVARKALTEYVAAH